MAIEALKKSETKQSLEAKKIQAYKEYFESTSKYFDEMNYIQLDSLQYHQKMLDDLLKENKEFKLSGLFEKFKKNDNEDEEIDLAYVENTENDKKAAEDIKDAVDAVDDTVDNDNENTDQITNQGAATPAYEDNNNKYESQDTPEPSITQDTKEDVTDINSENQGVVTPEYEDDSNNKDESQDMPLLTTQSSTIQDTEKDEKQNGFSKLKNIKNIFKKASTKTKDKKENQPQNKDNISGLKSAIKELIRISNNPEITNILKKLLVEISPIIDNKGTALKAFKRNTSFENLKALADKYNNLKNQFKDGNIIDDEVYEEIINANKEIGEKQYEYELMRTDYINDIETRLMNAAGVINVIIKTQKEAQKKLKEKKEKLEGKEKDTESLEKKIKSLKDKINLNSNICIFLLKLLRKDASSINTKTIKDVVMARKMIEMAKFENHDNEEYRKVMFGLMLKDNSRSRFNYKDETSEEGNLARFLFRLYYFVSHEQAIINIDSVDLHGPKSQAVDTEFCNHYKEICIGSEQGKIDDALKYLLEELEKTKKEDDEKAKFYETIKHYIEQLQNPGVKISINEAMTNIRNSCVKSISRLKSKLTNDSKIFKERQYFKIDKEIYNSKTDNKNQILSVTTPDDKLINDNDNSKKENENTDKKSNSNSNT